MGRIRRCRRCGVPLGLSRDLVWHGNGVITQVKDPDHRMVFLESEFLGELFEDLEERSGSLLEDMVVESKRNMTRAYMERQISPARRKLLHRFGPVILSRRITTMGRHYGYGDIRLLELRSKNDDLDFQTISIRHPYCLPLFCGDSLGAKEAMDGRDFSVSWEQAGDHEYTVSMRAGKHPLIMRLGQRREQQRYKQGDIRFERCPSCGVPLDVSRCHWNLEAGTIFDTTTGRRMAVFSPDSVETVLNDIEAELGVDMDEAVIDAQRWFVRKTLGREDALIDQRRYRDMAGLRGLGNVTKIDADGRHCTVFVENPCLPHFLVGIIQGLYEMGSENESVNRNWEMLTDGDLVVELEA